MPSLDRTVTVCSTKLKPHWTSETLRTQNKQSAAGCCLSAAVIWTHLRATKHSGNIVWTVMQLNWSWVTPSCSDRKTGSSRCNNVLIKSWFVFTIHTVMKSFVRHVPSRHISSAQDYSSLILPLVYQCPLCWPMKTQRRMTKPVNGAIPCHTEQSFFPSALYMLSQRGHWGSVCIQVTFTSWPLDTSLLGLHTEWEVSEHQ